MTAVDGKRVLVTGAASGIGAATMRAAVAAGARVAALDRRGDELAAAVEGLSDVVAVVADVTDLATLDEAVHGAVAALGGLDAVVHSAGMMLAGSVAATDPARWRAMFDVNVVGILAVTRAALPALLAGSAPSIVLVSSMSGRRVARAPGGVYAASKAAVHTIAETLRLELQPQGVRVTTVAPGFVRTPITDGIDDPELRAFYRGRLDEIGLEPDVIADAVVHVLAAPASTTIVEYAVVPTAQ